MRGERARLAYEDDLLLAYDKPVGLPVIAPEGSRSLCLLDIATEQVRRRNPKGRAAVVHRIDRDTSGIVVFAKSAAGKRLLMSGWDEIVTERLYVALVEGSMGSSEGELDTWLVEDPRGFVREAAPRERGAKRAVSRWRVAGEGGGLSLLEVRLDTGRKHQIRVQLAAAGHPVVGDGRYGAAPRGAGRGAIGSRGARGLRDGHAARPDRLCLHAAAIELRLPGSAAGIRIESPAPPEFAAAIRGRPEARKGERPGERLPPAADLRRGPRIPRAADAPRAAPGPRAPREDRRAKVNGRRGGAGASRNAARSGAPRARASSRPRKPSSRT